uniref:Histone H1 n=1 Tax=Aegilops tauschii TaxID=37682 RepID=M8D9B8_AEGTA
MGAPKQKWTSEEEEALRRGVLKHGAGKWRTIQKDPEFSPVLSSRSNIDLKPFGHRRMPSDSRTGDMGVDLGVQKGSKVMPLGVLVSWGFGGVGVLPFEEHEDNMYSSMILEALGELKEPNGSEVATICNFIEQRHEVQPNFRRLLCAKLRRLIGVNKVEKIDKSYKLTDSYAKRALAPMKDPSLKKKDSAKSSKAAKGLGQSSPALDAAEAAAMKVADAEAKSHLANEHMMEVERIGKMAEETESLLELASELYERCMPYSSSSNF